MGRMVLMGKSPHALVAIVGYALALFPSANPTGTHEMELERGLLSDQRKRELLGDDEMQRIKSDYLIKESANLGMQFISSKQTTAVANGIEYDLSQLEPLVESFEVSVDGHVQMPITPIYEGTVNGAHVIMRKDEKGCPEFISINDGFKPTSLVSVTSEASENIFLTMTPDDWDEEELGKYVLKDYLEAEPDSSVPEVTRQQNVAQVTQPRMRQRWHRKMQQTCSSFRMIDVAIAYDHTFCSRFGGANNAVTKIRTIVSLASEICEALCIKIRLSAVQGFCQASQDTYHIRTVETQSGCNTDNGLLQGFRSIWQNDSRFRNLPRDVAHIFMGQRFQDGGTVGCAWIGQLCNSLSYGVNSMSFSNSESQQALLFAHELGHNMGASHSSSGYVMSPYTNYGGKSWRNDVRNSITNYVRGRSCVSQQNNANDPPPPPSQPTYEIRATTNGGQGCWNHPAVNGQPMEVRRCNNSLRQRFAIDFRTGIVRTVRGNSCVTTTTNAGADQESVILASCTTSGIRRNWFGDGDGALRPRSNRGNCVSRKKSDLLIVPCAGDSLKDNRKWKFNRVRI